MSIPGHVARLDEGDFSGALAAWHTEFSGQEDSLEASWQLAEVEERWGDSLFFGDEPGSRAHYQAAQRALVPPGVMFSSDEENDRRMEAHQRLTNKLYAIGGDGKPRSGQDVQAHPRFKPIAAPKAVEPEPLKKFKSERREAVLSARESRTKEQSELSRLYPGDDHWNFHRLGQLWLEAAQALAPVHPSQAQRACGWSHHHFERYNRLWTAHLPASRWDSDGGQEMMEVQALSDSLAISAPEAGVPEWVPLFLDGDWTAALRAFGPDAPTPELKPLAALLADACKTAGREEEAAQLLAKLPS